MKKILAILLAALMLLSVVACGNGNNDTPDTPDDPETPDTPDTPADPEAPVEPDVPTIDYAVGKDDGNGNFIPTPAENTTGWVLWNVFANEAAMLMSPDMVGNYMMSQPYIPFFGSAAPLMPDPVAVFQGFETYQFSNFVMGATFGPMMSSIPFIGYVFDLEEGADVKAFIDQLVNNCDPRWMRCVDADQIVAGSIGNRVLFMMVTKDAITSTEVEAEILTPDVAEGSNAETIWNTFEAYMTENTEATAGDVANALAESAFAGTVTVAESALDHEIFKYGVDGFLSAAYIEAEDKTVYVIQLEMGYDIENWASYMFDGIEAPYGAYGMMILLMVNVD